ncbi:uncharacterized protein ELE39_003548 [Cryptosporidium sp. chipmunk genotype I]|uniref:uncharacterized protein n=1 Tax=Cryptosporidium sp. chipmunk genotype I TaxID=1280935 RepID=UPI00351A2147|nr:hypothetical protein ELE39_003548 [Cryptosporidium sp. chipmunk genotype I]
MNCLKLFCGLCLLVICLYDPRINYRIQHTSLANIRSSMKIKKTRSTRHECEQFAERYLNYLLLKNGLMFRAGLTVRYSNLLSSETNSGLVPFHQRKYEKSLKKLSEIATKVESKLEEAESLFELLLDCFREFGEKYSPDFIFRENKDVLRYLSSADTMLK